MTLGIQIDFQGKKMTFRGPGYFFYLWNNCVKQKFGSLSCFILLVPESVFRLDMASILRHQYGRVDWGSLGPLQYLRNEFGGITM